MEEKRKREKQMAFDLSYVPTLLITLLVAVLLLASAGIARRCMKTPEKCKEGANEKWIIGILWTGGILAACSFLGLIALGVLKAKGKI
jgi:hypothetical protein